MSSPAAARPAGDELEAQLAALHERSFGWALACCRWRREEAEEVLQTTYLKVLEGRARFRGESSFTTWLFAVIRRTAGELRRRRFRRELVWARERAREVEPAPARGPEASADASRLRSALVALPARQREVLHLVFYADLSIREAAGVMGVTLGTARTHYERGKHGLRGHLGAAHI